jgi:STE24 endopeptidase
MLNAYFILVSVTLLAVFLLSSVAKLINLSSLKSDLPQEFVGFYDPQSYAKSQAYTRATTLFGLSASLFDLIVLLMFWLLGGFNSLDEIVRSFGLHTIITGLLYVGFLALASALLSLPFDIYDTFVIEERFGFNRTTLRTFIADRVKGVLLGGVLGGLVIAAVLAFFQWAGPFAWLYTWAGISAFSLLVSFVAPTWIMPLFNRFKPLEEGPLRSAIFAYANSVAFPLRNVFVIDGSKRSSKSNAFFTGFGKNKRIALFDTLIEKHSVSELVSVLAHEVGHYKKKHITTGILVSIGYSGILLYLFSLIKDSRGLFHAFGIETISVYAGLVLFSILFSPVSFLLSIAMNVWSRHNEYQADRFAAETTSNPSDLITGLKKLSLTNLSNLTPHPLLVFLTYSHPPMLERIEAIRSIRPQVSSDTANHNV